LLGSRRKLEKVISRNTYIGRLTLIAESLGYGAVGTGARAQDEILTKLIDLIV